VNAVLIGLYKINENHEGHTILYFMLGECSLINPGKTGCTYYLLNSSPKYVVIRMKPERIRLRAAAGKGYEDIAVPK
jgi:hypothetical protein